MEHELTVAQVAAVLGLSVSGVHDRMRRGIIRGRQVNPRLWLISRDELERVKAQPIRRGRPRKQASDHPGEGE